MEPTSMTGRLNMFDLSRPVAYETAESCMPDSLVFSDGISAFHATSFMLPQQPASPNSSHQMMFPFTMPLQPNSNTWTDIANPYSTLDSPFLAVEVPLRSLDGNLLGPGADNNTLLDFTPRITKTKRQRRDDLSDHDGKKVFECQECSKVFSRANNLHAHMRIHTGEMPYGCDECGKSFARRSGLSRHQRTHTGEKPLKCLQCGRHFADSSNLSRHLRLHSGERPFECEVCHKRFSWKSSLEWHVRSHNED